MADKETTQGTTPGGKYLTKSYLVRNLQNFWNKIKEYIANQTKDLVNKDYVSGAIGNAVSGKADVSDLENLRTDVAGKASTSDLKDLEATVEDKASKGELTEGLAGKVDALPGKGLSTKDFTAEYESKLESLPSGAATESTDGLMSATDKIELNNLVRNAVTEVDNILSSTSTNPVQNRTIFEELNTKVSIENLKDPSSLLDQGLSYEQDDDGDIVLTYTTDPVRVKIHTDTGEIIEKFYRSFKDPDGNSINFNSFETNRNIRIPNPDGKGNLSGNRIYRFYIECFELSDTEKYKPFILKVLRQGNNPKQLNLSIFGK